MVHCLELQRGQVVLINNNNKNIENNMREFGKKNSKKTNETEIKSI